MNDPGALYMQRRAELIAILGEEKVREMESKLIDDFLIYGVRRPEGSPPLRGVLG